MSQKGAATILLTLLILACLLIIGLGISYSILAQLKMSQRASQAVVAYFAAEAGAEECLFSRESEDDPCWEGISGTLSNGAQYEAKRETENSVHSWGFFKQLSREIELTW